ncbi:hypothetical protein HN51_033329 [Arachis hypogaea]
MALSKVVKGQKGDGSRARHAWQCGLMVQRLVIPPLLGAQSFRCSVKPTWRSAPESKSQDT